ncbi:MAG: GGDEF domain-containing protein, partial [Planctomycetia bacterium]
MEADPPPGATFPPDDEAALRQLAASFSWLFHKRRELDRLRDLVYRDDMTGLFNRRYLDESLKAAVVDAEEKGTAAALILLDVDHFKKFNDTWGHAAGDETLSVVGTVLKHLFRPEDVVARCGGEEFAVLLRIAGGAVGCRRAAELWADRVRRETERLELRDEAGGPLSPITLSGGVAVFPYDAVGADSLFRAAD